MAVARRAQTGDRELRELNEAPLNEMPVAAESATDSAPIRLLAWTELVVAGSLTLAAFLLAVFMSSLIGAGGIETAEDYLHLTPDFFPRVTMLLLAAVSARYALGAARGLAKSTARHDAEYVGQLKRAGFMVIMAISYASAISWLGFILSTMLVAAVVSYFLGLRNPLAFIPGVFVVPILIRFVFERLLFIALPRSEIDFIAGIEDSVIRLLVKILL